MSFLTKAALFAGGAVFGRFGVDALAGEGARKFYVKATAAALRGRDAVMKAYEKAQENCSDILAEAKELNGKREVKEEAVLETIDDTSEES